MNGETTADIQQLLSEAIENHRRGELSDAHAGYQRILEISPNHPDALHLLGVVAYTMGNTQFGIDQVRQSLAVNPKQPKALNNLGNMLAQSEKIDEAIQTYQQAIELDEDYAEAHHNLGHVLDSAVRLGEAVKSYERAVELCPDSPRFRMALAITLESLGRFDDANDAFRKVLALQPDSIAAHKRLGAVLRKMHRLDEARKVYEEWLELSPEDPEALHFRSVCSPDDVPGKASESYIKRSFDGFADEFDECLTGLNYQVPELFRGLLESHFGNSIIGSGQLADLGCGTGLCAPHLRDRAERLVGIDLSSGMLAKAREREHYDELIEADIVEHLVGLRDTYDLLVAGDALIFFGDLRPVFKAAVQALREGGHFLFSVEQLNQDQADRDFGLSWSGRYQHSAAAIRRCLEESGLAVKDLIETPLRNEGNQPVIGYVVMAWKTSR